LRKLGSRELTVDHPMINVEGTLVGWELARETELLGNRAQSGKYHLITDFPNLGLLLNCH
jgi:hypothetical protein